VADEKNNPDDKKKGGRPTKLTPEITLNIAMSILEGNFRNVAAKRHGVGLRTLTRWLNLGKEYPDGVYGEFWRTIVEAEAEAELSCVAAIVRAGKTEDPKHLQWWLERKFPERWGRYRGELAELKKELAELRKLLEDSNKVAAG
jgi:hypothetical protein